MMGILLRRTIKDRRLSLYIYCGIGIILVWLYASLFPSLQKQSDKFNQLMDAYPKELMKAFDIESPGVIFSKFENFLATEQYSFMWPILVIALMVAWGAAGLAGEVEKGTIELLLAQPISRLRIFFGKYLSGLVALAIFTAITVFCAIPLAAAYEFGFQTENYIKVAIIGFLFGLAIYSITMFLSAIFSEKGKVYFLTTGLVVIMYVLNLVANLKDNLSDLKYFSFFHYFATSDALMKNQIDPWAYLVFGGTILVTTILGVMFFIKRDITA